MKECLEIESVKINGGGMKEMGNGKGLRRGYSRRQRKKDEMEEKRKK